MIFEERRNPEWTNDHLQEIHGNEMKYDSDVAQIAVNFEEKLKKYFLYRANADFLQLNLGLFHPDTNILGDVYFD